MRKNVLAAFLFALSLQAAAQKDITKAEDNLLWQAYRSCLLELTAIHSNQVCPVRNLTQVGVPAGIPIFERGQYKYVYWRLDPLPKVYATVYYNNKADRESAKYDGTIREFTPLEAFAFRIVEAVKSDIAADPNFKFLPNAFITVTPVIESDNYHVYVTWKAREEGMVIFGNDYDYTFDSNSIMLSKRKIHSNISYSCIDSVDQAAPLNRIGFHSHEGQNLRGFCVTCLETVYTFYSVLKWKTFYLTDLTHVYAFDLATSNLTRFTHAEFEKNNAFTFKSIIK